MTTNKVLIIQGNATHSPQDELTEQIRQNCLSCCEQLDVEGDFRLATSVAELESVILQNMAEVMAVIFSPGGLDSSPVSSNVARALIAGQIPLVEVHATDAHRKDTHTLHLLHEPGVQIGFVSGLGTEGYELAIRAVVAKIRGGATP